MRKIIIIILLLSLFSCKSVANWDKEAVLSQETIDSARIYVTDVQTYNRFMERRNILDIKGSLSADELDNFLEL